MVNVQICAAYINKPVEIFGNDNNGPKFDSGGK
jgi:hypothetical protein